MLSPHPIGALRFDAVPVTADDVLGEIDRGFRVVMGTLNLFRPSVGAFAVGMARAALDATLEHTARRRAFGGVLKDLQTVAHQVAEMALRTEAARLMVYAAATAYDEGAPDVPKRVAMAKLLATETAQYVVDTAVQLHGARALRRGHLLEHLYREVRAPRIYEGASEVQRAIIAKELYGELRGDAPVGLRGDVLAGPRGVAPEDWRGDVPEDWRGSAPAGPRGEALVGPRGVAPEDRPEELCGDGPQDRPGDVPAGPREEAPEDRRGDAPVGPRGEAPEDRPGEMCGDAPEEPRGEGT